MTEHQYNTGPKAPADALRLQAESLRKTVTNRETGLKHLIEEMANMIALNKRDMAFAEQYEASANQLDAGEGGIILSVSLEELFGGGK